MRTLTKEERQYLLGKYMKSGLDFDIALIKVNKFHDYLKDLRDRLRIKKVSDIDIEIKFKQEFEKLVMSLEN
jgi:hypothetical protein